ncbi:hypothetical protein FJZ17_02280 [Candidatus Pacearchaeota archaeon]|nr:hypothetical protein [Candidatus Pacearchaeota archaeon]
MNKRGQNEILTTVILVIIGLAALAILGGFITNMVKDNVKQAEMTSQVSGLELQKVEYMIEGTTRAVRVAIKKQAETPEDLVAIKIVIILKDGTSRVLNVPYNEIGLLETDYIDLLLENNEEVQKVELVPQYGFKGKVIPGKTSSAWTGEVKTNPSCKQKITTIEKPCGDFTTEQQCGSQPGSCRWAQTAEGACSDPNCDRTTCMKPFGCSGSWADVLDCSQYSWDESNCINVGCTPSYESTGSCNTIGDEYTCSYSNGCYPTYYNEYTSCLGITDQWNCENYASSGCSPNYENSYGDCSNMDEYACNSYLDKGCWINLADECDAWENTDQGTCEGNGCYWSEPDCYGRSAFSTCGGQYISSTSFISCGGEYLSYSSYQSCGGDTYHNGFNGCSGEQQYSCIYTDLSAQNQIGRCDVNNCGLEFGCAGLWEGDAYTCSGDNYQETTNQWVC